MGEFAAGSGSFVRYAKALGATFEWVAEAVPRSWKPWQLLRRVPRQPDTETCSLRTLAT